MPSITIIKWNPGFAAISAWSQHTASEMKKRLKEGIKAPAADVRRLASAIRNRNLVTLTNVRAESVASITQILQILGAEVNIDLESANRRKLFQKQPKRGR